MNSQEKTLQTYEDHFDRYLTETTSEVSGDFKDFFTLLIMCTPGPISILEIGSATGRDADFFESRFRRKEVIVTRTDAIDASINYQKSKGKKVTKLNILTDTVEGKWDIVFANSVFLHFTKEEFLLAMKKCLSATEICGYIAFIVKEGAGEEYSDHKMGAARYFKYWHKEELKELLEKNGFNIFYLEYSPEKKRLFCIVINSD